MYMNSYFCPFSVFQKKVPPIYEIHLMIWFSIHEITFSCDKAIAQKFFLLSNSVQTMKKEKKAPNIDWCDEDCVVVVPISIIKYFVSLTNKTFLWQF